MKYLELLKTQLSKEKDQQTTEKDFENKAKKVALLSQKHLLDLQIELSEKEKALDIALFQDSINFRSISEIKKEINIKKQEIKDHEEFHKEMFLI